MKRQRCKRNEHLWRMRRNGSEECRLCGSEFPCPGFSCTHTDCIERAIEMGVRKGYPDVIPYVSRIWNADGTLLWSAAPLCRQCEERAAGDAGLCDICAADLEALGGAA